MKTSYYGKRLLWLIAARSESKSIPDKNIKPLGGIPLLAWRIKSALKIANKEDIWVSTDSKHYADIARKYGAFVPFIRPSELSTDTAKSADVVLHAMNWAESIERNYDAVGLLEPTSPFIKSSRLEEAVDNLFMEEEAENIVAVRVVKPSSFYIQEDTKYLSVIARNIASKGLLRRQDEKKEITPSGGLYIAKWGAFKRNRTFYTNKTLSYVVPDLEGLEIDEPIDWEWAEFLIEKEKIDIGEII
jgi:N-acylneuraminate cytidylyltransferase/CMP-N,N'-diacetyllegionaminic acid synthase